MKPPPHSLPKGGAESDTTLPPWNDQSWLIVLSPGHRPGLRVHCPIRGLVEYLRIVISVDMGIANAQLDAAELQIAFPFGQRPLVRQNLGHNKCLNSSG